MPRRDPGPGGRRLVRRLTDRCRRDPRRRDPCPGDRCHRAWGPRVWCTCGRTGSSVTGHRSPRLLPRPSPRASRSRALPWSAARAPGSPARHGSVPVRSQNSPPSGSWLSRNSGSRTVRSSPPPSTTRQSPASPCSSSPDRRVHGRRACSRLARTVPMRRNSAASGGPPGGTTGMKPTSSSWSSCDRRYSVAPLRSSAGRSAQGTTRLFTRGARGRPFAAARPQALRLRGVARRTSPRPAAAGTSGCARPAATASRSGSLSSMKLPGTTPGPGTHRRPRATTSVMMLT